MKNILMLVGLITLSGCASTPFTFDGDNANKGFVVISTSYDQACVDEVENVNISILNSKSRETGKNLIVKNLFSAEDFNDGSIVHTFPLDSGEYVMDTMVRPNKIMAFIMNKFYFAPVKLDVKAGSVQYLGNLYVESKSGACDLENIKVTKRSMKKRDMKKAAEKQPQLING